MGTGESRAAEPAAELRPVRPVISLGAVPFEPSEVRLLDGPFRAALLRDRDYLLSLDPDRLLHTFRINAGLPTAAQPLGGWEAPGCEVRGHSLGHYLTACALMHADTGDERLKARVDAIVAGLAQCQAALAGQGAHPGYLAAFPESFFDRVDAGQPVWAPYYTLHKIMAGLLDAWMHCGNRQALNVLVRMAEWQKFRVDRLSVEQMQRALGNEHGGMMEVLANLYAVTGNPEHLRLARAFDHRVVFDPLARGEDRLNGLHANTQIPKITGAARLFEPTGDERYRNIALCFWRRVALARSYAIGGHSDNEHFFPIEQFSHHLSPATCETCNTYNMLKLTRHLFGWAALRRDDGLRRARPLQPHPGLRRPAVGAWSSTSCRSSPGTSRPTPRRSTRSGAAWALGDMVQEGLVVMSDVDIIKYTHNYDVEERRKAVRQ